MNSKELKERLEKALITVDKKKATIEKHKALAEKKLAVIKKGGWEPDESLYRGDNYNGDALNAIYDYQWKVEDIKSAERKLKEAEEIASNWRGKLDKQLEKDRIMAKEMPAIFTQCRDELAKRWQETDIRRRDEMFKKRKELSYEDFRKLYKYTMEDDLRKTDEQFYQIELREAELFIIDLYNRVKAITGEVTDWEHIHYSGGALNGVVTGKDGKARVESILAGGYNIQRLHIRVLVHEIK